MACVSEMLRAGRADGFKQGKAFATLEVIRAGEIARRKRPKKDLASCRDLLIKFWALLLFRQYSHIKDTIIPRHLAHVPR